jgi:hypothetical protein
VIRTVAAEGLGTTPTGTEPTADLAAIDRERLTGLAVAALRAGRLCLSPDETAHLADDDERWQIHALRLEALLLDVAARFDAAGIDYLVLKGPALAHTIYPDAALRPFGDLDLLVPARSLYAARDLLVRDLDAAPVLPELRPGFDARFAKDLPVRVGRVEIDLHRSIAAGPFGLRLPVVELFDHSTTFELGGAELATLDLTATFVQVCCNAALGDVPARLLSLRDVAQVALSPGFAFEPALELARRWRLEPVVAHAVRLAWDAFALPGDAVRAWADTYEPSAHDRRLLHASTAGVDRGYTSRVAALAAIPGIGAKLRFLHAVTWPQRSYLDARGWSRTRLAATAWKRLRRAS